jgi:hypothetical protein
MSDPFTSYETGLERLLEQLGSDHPRYVEALTLQSRLLENIIQARQYSDTETRRAERAQTMSTLNCLALEAVGVSFNELCSEERGVPPHPLSRRVVELSDVKVLGCSVRYIGIFLSLLLILAFASIIGGRVLTTDGSEQTAVNATQTAIAIALHSSYTPFPATGMPTRRPTYTSLPATYTPTQRPSTATQTPTSTPTRRPTYTSLPATSTPSMTPTPIPITPIPIDLIIRECEAGKFEDPGRGFLFPLEACYIPQRPNAIKLSWDVAQSRSYAGCIIDLPPEFASVAQANTHLILWVQGEGGGEQFKIGLLTSDGTEWKETLPPAFVDGHQVSVPLVRFVNRGIDLSQLDRLIIAFEHQLGQGSRHGGICIDEVGFGSP